VTKLITFDELEEMLMDIAFELPDDLFRGLNGGVFLLPGGKLHPESSEPGGLFILGEYHHEPRGLGRYITVYYGSFVRVYGGYDPARQKEFLKKIVFHEFTHHLESLAGEKELEIKDALDIMRYKKKNNRP